MYQGLHIPLGTVTRYLLFTVFNDCLRKTFEGK